MLALLYDIHGNLPALEAVLDDARGREVRRWLVGGDVAAFGPHPVEAVGRLRELQGAAWIRGNTERWLVDRHDVPGPMGPAVAACAETLGEALVVELAGLPESARIDATTAAWHASPVSDMRSFLPEPADDEDELLEGVGDRRLVFGHTHLQFQRIARRGVELLNPGSVGMPLDGDRRAAYALVHDDGALELRRVEYDADASARALRERFGGEWVEIIAGRLERARA